MPRVPFLPWQGKEPNELLSLWGQIHLTVHPGRSGGQKHDDASHDPLHGMHPRQRDRWPSWFQFAPGPQTRGNGRCQ
jgi:hypothetical protein